MHSFTLQCSHIVVYCSLKLFLTASHGAPGWIQLRLYPLDTCNISDNPSAARMVRSSTGAERSDYQVREVVNI